MNPSINSLIAMNIGLRIMALALGIIVMPSPSVAAPPMVSEPANDELRRNGWRLMKFDGIPETVFESTADGAISVSTTASCGILFRRLDKDMRRPFVSWRWKVLKGLPPTDQSLKGGDDRPIAVHVWFEPTVATAGFFRTMADMLGFDMPGRGLIYVWGGLGAGEGEVLINPYNAERSRIIILRGGRPPENVWMAERVDMAADYRRAYGEDPPPPMYIAISGDSDDLQSKSLALIRDLIVVSGPPG